MGKSTKVKLLNSKVDLKPIPIITKIQHHNSPAYPVGSIFKNAQLLSKGESAQINDKTQITPSAGMTDISSIQAQMLNLSAMASFMGMNAFFVNLSKYLSNAQNSRTGTSSPNTSSDAVATLIWALNNAAGAFSGQGFNVGNNKNNDNFAENLVGSNMTAEVARNSISDFIMESNPSQKNSEDDANCSKKICTKKPNKSQAQNLQDSIKNFTSPTKSSAGGACRPPPRNMNNWICLGQFNTEEEMHVVRSKEKVSKRRTEQLKNGVKVRYRCNKWKRTKCGYQMYSFFTANNGPIELYETGEHDHSGRRMIEFEMNKRNKEINDSISPDQTQQQLTTEDLFNSLFSIENIKNEEVIINVAGDGFYHEQKNENDVDEEARQVLASKRGPKEEFLTTDVDYEMSTSSTHSTTARLLDMTTFCSKVLENADVSPEMNGQESGVVRQSDEHQVKEEFDDVETCVPNIQPFSLLDKHCASELIRIAADFGISIRKNETSEFDYQFYSDQKLNGCSLTLKENVQDVTLVSKTDEGLIYKECWRKSDLPQFLWAISGKCAYLFAKSCER